MCWKIRRVIYILNRDYDRFGRAVYGRHHLVFLFFRNSSTIGDMLALKSKMPTISRVETTKSSPKWIYNCPPHFFTSLTHRFAHGTFLLDVRFRDQCHQRLSLWQTFVHGLGSYEASVTGDNHPAHSVHHPIVKWDILRFLHGSGQFPPAGTMPSFVAVLENHTSAHRVRSHRKNIVTMRPWQRNTALDFFSLNLENASW